MWVLVQLAILLIGTLCGSALSQTLNDFYSEINQKHSKAALNCSNKIPEDWRELMRTREPPNDMAGNHIMAEYLLSCLHERLVFINETSPFSYTPEPQILYDIILNQMVSLSFDGTLVTKAYSLL